MSTPRQWVIGRAPDCDIVLNGPGVSGRHCCLSRTDMGYQLEDLGSTNGTFVNGGRIAGPVVVTRADRITLGLQTPLPWPSEPAPARQAPTWATPTPAPAPRPLPVPSYVPAPTPLIGTPGLPGTGPRKILRIGRAATNEIVLDHATVSGHHARLILEGDRAILEDLNSSNGTAVGNPDHLITKAVITRDDVVFFGSLRVQATRLMGMPEAPRSPLQSLAPVVSARKSSLLLGRAPDCDQVLDYPIISARHARLIRQNDNLILEDLASTSGTFVNGTRVSRPVVVRPGDQISLGSYSFTLTPEGTLHGRDLRGNSSLECRGLMVRAGKRVLIANISVAILPGEFVGLMGPSGAGKTTLMNALNGYTPPAAGAVLLNGQDLYRHYDQFRSVLGYVPQDDVMHRDLTVGQALYYSARLRLPPDFSRKDILKRIAGVLAQLGLQGTEDVLIGSAEKKGISGGQRRRVNLAMELLTDPLVLYLDEPTSGLSSEDALTVMRVLRQLADQGKTILLTIHQPSLEVYRLMDNLLLLGKDRGSPEPGQLVYFGPAYPDAVHHFNPEGVPGLKPGIEPSPDEVLRGLSKRTSGEWAQRYQTSRHYERFVKQRANSQPDPNRGSSTKQRRRISPWFQWLVLVQRLIAIKLRDRMNTAILLIQAPIVAVLLVMVFGKQMREAVTQENWPDLASTVGRTLFVMAFASLWFGASNAVREIVGEWAVYHRERMVSLRIGPYIASKLTVLGGLAFIQCLTLLIIVDVGCGLKSNRLTLFAFLILAALVGTVIGLIISALAKSNEVAIALLPLVLIPMFILSGFTQPLHDLDKVTRVITHTMPTRWAFEGLLLTESAKRKNWSPKLPPVPPGMKAPDPEPERDMAEFYFKKDKHRTSAGLAAGVLAGMLFGGLSVVALILRLRDVH